MYLSLLTILPLLADTLAGSENRAQRIKREGFGPWEAQDAWDEKGESNVFPAIKELTEVLKTEAEVLVNVTNNIIQEVKQIAEHPFDNIWKLISSNKVVEVIAIIIAFLILCKILTYGRVFLSCIFNLIKSIIGFIWGIVKFIFRTVITVSAKTTWLSLCCASWPFITIRMFYYKRKMSRKAKELDEEMQLAEPYGTPMTPFIEGRSQLQLDSGGPYVVSGNNKIYINLTTQLKEQLTLASAPAFPAEISEPTCSNVKESLLPSSKIYAVSSLPDFVGEIKVEENIVGLFSRIRYKNQDCILTATHVLEMNKGYMLDLCHNGVTIKTNSIKRCTVMAISPIDELDFIIIAVSPEVFSRLQMKCAKLAPKATTGTPIRVYSYREFAGETRYGFSIGTLGSYYKPFQVEYKASTLRGSSGGPILNSRSEIIGIHLEADNSSGVNVGVIPPVFRNKETAATGDVLSEDRIEREIEEDDADIERRLENEMYVYFMLNESHKLDFKIHDENTQKSWAEIMDEEFFEEDQRNMLRFVAWKNENEESFRKHKQRRIKGNKYRKETPLICPTCHIICQEGFKCPRCKSPLVKDLRVTSSDVDNAREVFSGHLAKTAVDAMEKDLLRQAVVQIVRDCLANEIQIPFKKDFELIRNDIRAMKIEIEDTVLRPLERTNNQLNIDFDPKHGSRTPNFKELQSKLVNMNSPVGNKFRGDPPQTRYASNKENPSDDLGECIETEVCGKKERNIMLPMCREIRTHNGKDKVSRPSVSVPIVEISTKTAQRDEINKKRNKLKAKLKKLDKVPEQQRRPDHNSKVEALRQSLQACRMVQKNSKETKVPSAIVFGEDFGLSSACILANEMMNEMEIDPKHCPFVLSEIMCKWPGIYNTGDPNRTNDQRAKELRSFIRNVCLTALQSAVPKNF